MNEKLNKSLQAAAEKYADNTSLRAAVQAIPYVGGSIDTLFAGRVSKIQQARVEHLFQELAKRLVGLEAAPKFNEENLYDIVMAAMDKAIRTRVSEKRAIFSNIIYKHLVEGLDVEESELAFIL